jgi:hypothetical protein
MRINLKLIKWIKIQQKHSLNIVTLIFKQWNYLYMDFNFFENDFFQILNIKINKIV